MKISGIVFEGKKEGRQMGYPTANIRVTPHIFSGVYGGEVEIEKKKKFATVYVGNKRPSILEAHLLDFTGDLYGKKIIVRMGEKIREDMDVRDVNVLKELIASDIIKVRDMAKNNAEKPPENTQTI